MMKGKFTMAADAQSLAEYWSASGEQLGFASLICLGFISLSVPLPLSTFYSSSFLNILLLLLFISTHYFSRFYIPSSLPHPTDKSKWLCGAEFPKGLECNSLQ